MILPLRYVDCCVHWYLASLQPFSDKFGFFSFWSEYPPQASPKNYSGIYCWQISTLLGNVFPYFQMDSSYFFGNCDSFSSNWLLPMKCWSVDDHRFLTVLDIFEYAKQMKQVLCCDWLVLTGFLRIYAELVVFAQVPAPCEFQVAADPPLLVLSTFQNYSPPFAFLSPDLHEIQSDHPLHG